MNKLNVFLISGMIMTNHCFNKNASSQEISAGHDEVSNKNISITIVYDNTVYDTSLKTAFGFSCVIKSPDKNILFDTGSESRTLLSNMSKLGIDPGDIDIVVLSHIHRDHVGGLAGFLTVNPDVTVYLPASFPEDFKKEIKDAGARCIVSADPVKITAYVQTTGELPGPPQEQSLLISAAEGMVVVTGCAHPGIVNIVKRSRELTDESIYLALGGFHLSQAGFSDIADIIDGLKALGVKKIAPSHCSGTRAMGMFKEAYGENYVESGAGKVFDL